VSKELYVGVASTCSSCGGEVAVEIFAHRPSRQDLEPLELALGGASCIRTFVAMPGSLGVPAIASAPLRNAGRTSAAADAARSPCAAIRGHSATTRAAGAPSNQIGRAEIPSR